MILDVVDGPPSSSGTDSLQRWAAWARGRKFVWLMSPPWDGVWTRQNHFAVRLARLGADVLYVEGVPSWFSLLMRRKWADVHLFRGVSVRPVAEGIQVMRISTQFPGSARAEWIGGLNGRLAAKPVEHWLVENGWDDCIYWCRVPASIYPLRRLPESSCVVYDVTDDYELYARDAGAREAVRRQEAEMLDEADLVLVASQQVLGKPTLAGRPVEWIPNGVDYDLFAGAAETDLTVDPAFTGRAGPVIGYVGRISRWMDFELVRRLAERWPGQVVMIGPVDADVEEIAKSIRGVEFVGLVPHRSLPDYIRGFAVCVMPHLDNELRRNANPLKVWEYLATGKPIVSVDHPVLHGLEAIVDVARDPAHFVELVERCLNGQASGSAAERQRIARDYSWDRIFDRMMTALVARCPGAYE